MSLLDEIWNFEEDILLLSNIEKEYFINFKQQVNNSDNSVLKTIENRFIAEEFEYTITKRNNNDDLLNYVEDNKTIRKEIDLKAKEIRKQQSRYEILKKDQLILSQEIKEKYEAFLMAKKYYKKYLNVYFTIESKNDDKQIIFFQFFTDTKKDSEMYSIRLQKNLKNGKYELLSTTPALEHSNDIRRKLQKCNDVPGAVCCIKQAFEKIKMSKKI